VVQLGGNHRKSAIRIDKLDVSSRALASFVVEFCISFKAISCSRGLAKAATANVVQKVACRFRTAGLDFNEFAGFAITKRPQRVGGRVPA